MKKHLIETLNKGARYDGRKMDEFRDIKIETDVSANAEGSARVTIGDTVVLAGVKLAIEKPYADTPNKGNLMVNAELSPLASPDFEAGPPSAESIELARVVDRGIRESEAINPEELCIEEGEKVWSVGIDVVAINAGGNLIDAAGIAALVALKNTKLPEIVDGALDYKHRTKNTLPIAKEPIPVTIFKIGEHFIVDPTIEEEKEADARLTVAVLKKGMICAMQKGGVEPLSVDEIDQMVGTAIKKAEEIRKVL